MLAKLKAMPYLKPSYVLDNHFFVGVAAHQKERLKPDFAEAALDLLHEEAAEDDSGEVQTTVKTFKTTICPCVKLVELWKISTVRHFRLATDSPQPQLARVIAHLLNPTGIKKVKACYDLALIAEVRWAVLPIPECFR